MSLESAKQVLREGLEPVIRKALGHIHDPFQSIVLHHQRVDWSDPKWDRHSLSKFYIGSQAHWNDGKWNWNRPYDDPEGFGPKGGPMEPIEIERAILLSVPPRKWGGLSPMGNPYYQHMLTLIKLMFPKTDITDTLADAAQFFCMAMTYGKKILNLIGGQNMSKTAGACRIAFVTMFINPEYTRWTVSNPFDNVADSGVWGEVLVLWDDLADAWPGGTHTVLFPKAVPYSDRRIEFIPDRPRVARMELRNIKHTGKGKGAKSRKGDENEDVGVFGEIVDEINEIDNMSFLTRVVNSASQGNYICITGQNFKDTEDMGGQITEPVDAYKTGDAPDAFEKLNVESDLWWHSVHAGITLRFDGHNSANILAGRVIYPYLFKEEDRLRIAEGGTESPSYMSQVRSFPVHGAGDNMLLSKPKLSASRHTDPFYAIAGPSVNVAFCDPAFGGRDKAVYGSALFAPCMVRDAEGGEYRQELLIVPDVFFSLQLTRDAVFNDFWHDRYQAVGLNPRGETRGALISYEDQIAIQCREYNKHRGVPEANFGYDFSMRPDIVTSMNKIIGFSSLAFSYPHPPTGMPILNFKGKGVVVTGKVKKEDAIDSRVFCKNKLTEMGMFIADVFLSKAFRGGEKIPTALVQLCRTRLTEENNKYIIEDKAKYKERYNGVSPDHRDVLMGLGAVAALRGFRAELKTAVRDSGKGQGGGTFNLLKQSKKFRNPGVARLPTLSR